MSSNRDGSAASFGRANFRSSDGGAQFSHAQAVGGNPNGQFGIYPQSNNQVRRPSSHLSAMPPAVEYPLPEVEEENYVSGAAESLHEAPIAYPITHVQSISIQEQRMLRSGSSLTSNINSSKSIGVTGKRQSFSPYPNQATPIGANSASGSFIQSKWQMQRAGSSLNRDPEQPPNKNAAMHPQGPITFTQPNAQNSNLKPQNAQGGSNKNINLSVSRFNNASTSKSSFLHQQSLQGMQLGSLAAFTGGNYFNVHSNKQLQSSVSSISNTNLNQSRDRLSNQEVESILLQQRMLTGKQSQPSIRQPQFLQKNGNNIY